MGIIQRFVSACPKIPGADKKVSFLKLSQLGQCDLTVVHDHFECESRKKNGFFLPTLIFILVLGIAPPNYGKSYNILDFGAISNGIAINTEAIQRAIDEVNIKGGGKIVFPSGKFLTGSIQLKSNVELCFEEGAVLLGSTSPYDYFKVKGKEDILSSNANDNSELGLILAFEAKNIKISGLGTIDGQGLPLALTIDSLHHAGVLIDENYNSRRMRPSELVRPKLFRFLGCENVEIKNITLTNSASWGLSFDLCRDLVLDNLTVINRAYWNNDGIDITDCKNVKITNCNINAADDGICLKSYHPETCNDSIYVANCTVRSSASAIKFGTASFGGFKNITIENIKVFDTFRSAIAIESVDGAVIENVIVRGIVAENTGNAIFIRLGHRGGKSPGVVKNIHISDMKVEIPFGRPDINYDLRGPEVDFFHNPFPASITGIPGHKVANVTIENIEIIYPGRATKGMAYIPLSDLNRIPEQIEKYPEFSMFGELPAWGFYVRHANSIVLNNIYLRLEKKDFRPAFVFDDVANLIIKSVEVENAGDQAQFVLKDVANGEIDFPDEKIVRVK